MGDDQSCLHKQIAILRQMCLELRQQMQDHVLVSKQMYSQLQRRDDALKYIVSVFAKDQTALQWVSLRP